MLHLNKTEKGADYLKMKSQVIVCYESVWNYFLRQFTVVKFKLIVFHMQKTSPAKRSPS